MIKLLNYIIPNIKFIPFLCVIYALTIKPAMASFALIENINNDIVWVDLDEDSNENQENEEEENKEFEKLNPFISCHDSNKYSEKKIRFVKQDLLKQISLDIHTPPPEKA